MADADTELKMSAPNRAKNFFKYHWGGIYMILVPMALAPLCVMEEGTKQWRCGYMILVMLAFWIPEVLPTYVTAYIPIVVVPLCGIWDSDPTCMSYFTGIFFFFFGAALIAAAIEVCGLHTLLALRLLRCLGTNPRVLHLGLMLLTMLLSIFMSNIGGIGVMFPITRAILNELEGQGMVKTLKDTPGVETDQPYPTKIVIGFYLGIAYAASIGGIILPTGSDITRELVVFHRDRFPNAPHITPLEFLGYSAPMALTIIALIYFWMQFMYMGLLRPKSAAAQELKEGQQSADTVKVTLKEKSMDLGRVTCHQIQVILLLFVWVALLLTRKPGYSDLQKLKDIDESMPTILVVMVLFLLPANYYFLKYLICKRPEKEFIGKNSALLTWGAFQKYMQWGLLSLVGCGFALAKSIEKSGLAVNFTELLYEVKNEPEWVLQIVSIMTAMFYCTFSNNGAMFAIMLPHLNELAVTLEVNPKHLSLPTALAYNCAFLFPVSSVPNAIVHGMGNINTITMIIGGIVPTLISILVICGFSNMWIIMTSETHELPDWAKNQTV